MLTRYLYIKPTPITVPPPAADDSLAGFCATTGLLTPAQMQVTRDALMAQKLNGTVLHEEPAAQAPPDEKENDDEVQYVDTKPPPNPAPPPMVASVIQPVIPKSEPATTPVPPVPREPLQCRENLPRTNAFAP